MARVIISNNSAYCCPVKVHCLWCRPQTPQGKHKGHTGGTMNTNGRLKDTEPLSPKAQPQWWSPSSRTNMQPRPNRDTNPLLCLKCPSSLLRSPKGVFVRQGLTIRSWLTWNSLYRPYLAYQTHIDSTASALKG